VEFLDQSLQFSLLILGNTLHQRLGAIRRGKACGYNRRVDLIDRFAAIPYTGALSDIMDEMGFTNQVLPKEIQAVRPGQTLAGRALTVTGERTLLHTRDEYYRPFLKMLGDIRPGDVVVTQPNDDTVAHFGELSCETAKFRGGRGVVINGGMRDVEYAMKIGFPVFCRYLTPLDTIGRWRLVDYNVPITIGTVLIESGDYVVGDRDGVVVVPQTVAGEVLEKAEECVRTENLVRKAILEGAHPVAAYEKYGRF
jgi:regulator of RNase E activity RraA